MSKLGRALVELAGAARPPLRYAAGSDAQQYLNDKLAAVSAELAQWRGLSLSTDHDDLRGERG